MSHGPTVIEKGDVQLGIGGVWLSPNFVIPASAAVQSLAATDINSYKYS